jgi:hypothetical protein
VQEGASERVARRNALGVDRVELPILKHIPHKIPLDISGEAGILFIVNDAG